MFSQSLVQVLMRQYIKIAEHVKVSILLKESMCNFQLDTTLKMYTIEQILSSSSDMRGSKTKNDEYANININAFIKK